MKRLSFMLVVLSALTGNAQITYRSNFLYFEFLGNGIGSSISYEKQLMHEPGLGVRVGIGYLSGDAKFRASIPLGLNYLLALKNTKSFIDFGFGATWSEATAIKPPQIGVVLGSESNEHIWSVVPSVGIRHHTKGSFMWRASLTPVINRYKTLPWIGLTIGKMF